MKKKILLSALCLIFLCQIKSQTIIPLEITEMCPLTDLIFTVTLPVASGISVTNNNSNSTVVLDANSISTTGTKTTFQFTGKFADRNEEQSFLVKYNGISKLFKFNKIKSLYNSGPNNINPTPGLISVPRCQPSTINIQFPLIQYTNTYTTPTTIYGTVTTYEYLLPAGWKLGTVTSDGSTWLSSSNNVNVTTDISGGDNSSIQIRAVNSCGPGLAKGVAASIQTKRPWPTFTISPTSVPITCSYSVTKTFTVTPTQSALSCPVTYSWYLGPNSNWTYPDGSAIPTATFTTSTNSITLKSVAIAPSYANIKVTPTLSGVTMPTLTCTAGLTAPNYAIIGPTSLCTGTSAAYTIYNLTAGSSVYWYAITTLPNYGTTVVQVNSPYAQQTTLTKINGGVITLHATVTNPCGQTVELTRENIAVGGYSSTPISGYVLAYPPNNPGGNAVVNQINATGPYGTTVYSATVYANCTNNVTISNPAFSTATWSKVSGNVWSWSSNGPYLQLYPGDYNTIQFRLTNNNQCGSQYYDFYFYPANYGSYSYIISPNPTTDMITISTDENKSLNQNTETLATSEISEVVILDKTGMMQSKKSFGKGTTQITMNVDYLISGLYLVKIFDGQKWSSLKFVKQ